MQIITCTNEHLHQMLSILNEVIEHTTSNYDYEPKSEHELRQWLKEKQDNGFPVLGVLDEYGFLAGFATYGPWRKKKGYRFTYEHSIYVAKDQRRKGYAQYLLSELFGYARSSGGHCLVAVIDADNLASIALHEGFGFSKCGHLREVGYKFNRYLDLVLYQLLLNPEEDA